MHENCEKGNSGQNCSGDISNEWIFLQFMGIEPQHKNIDGKEQYGFKGNIARKNDRKEIEHKIGREFGALAHQSIEHCLPWTVDQILLTVIKTVDNITAGNCGGRGQYE